MAVIIKALGANTITGPGTTILYTVPAGKSALVKSVRLANGNTAGTPAMNLYVKPSGATERRIHKVGFTISAKLSLALEDVVTLGQGDDIRLIMGSGAGTSVGYMVNGVERE